MPRSAASPAELSAEEIAQLLAAAQRRPQLADIPWHDDEAVFDGTAPVRTAPASVSLENDPATFDPVRRRIRDRYIGVRFAGVARGAADLENATRVIKAARLILEERQPEASLELLALAIEQSGADPRLRLAQLEIAYLVRDAVRYVAAALEFRELFPRSAEWPEIARLGRRVAPDEPLFDVPEARQREREASSAQAPQWIETPWDLAPQLDTADFHRAMIAETPRGH